MAQSEWEDIVDAATDKERLAASIQLSLRNLDASVQQISEFYHNELINQLASGNTEGRGVGTARDETLYATVQSFFVYVGAVRDHLAAFVAAQIGKDTSKVDAMNRLLDVVRDPDIASSAILEVLQRRGLISPAGGHSTKWRAAGWLEHASTLRNEFVHRRAYGQRTAEKMGRLRQVDAARGFYRYQRPMIFGPYKSDSDVLDVNLDIYEAVNELMHECATVSGHDITIQTLTDKDIISVSVSGREM